MTELAPQAAAFTGPALDFVADELNDPPRAVLGFLTPRDVFTELLTDAVAPTA